MTNTAVTIYGKQDRVDTALDRIPDEELALFWAEKLKRVVPASVKNPKNQKHAWTKEDFVTVTWILVSNGIFPLAWATEYTAWKDDEGLHVHRYYGSYINWCQEIEPFDIIQRDYRGQDLPNEGYDQRDFIADTWVIRRSNSQKYTEIYKINLDILSRTMDDPREAMKVAQEEAAQACGRYQRGVVQAHEVYYPDGNIKKGGAGYIKGWVPGVSRARLRSLVGALRSTYGTMSPADSRARNIRQYGSDLPALTDATREYGDDSIVIDHPEARERYMQLVAQTAQNEAERKKQEGSIEDLRTFRAQRQDQNNMLIHNPNMEEPVGEDWKEALYEAQEGWISEMRAELRRWGYNSDEAQDTMVERAFSCKFEELTEDQRHNALEWAKRRQYLTNSKITIPERIAALPEKIEARTIKDAMKWYVDQIKQGQVLEEWKIG